MSAAGSSPDVGGDSKRRHIEAKWSSVWQSFLDILHVERQGSGWSGEVYS